MAIRRPLDTNIVDVTGADLASDIAISTTGNIATTGSGTLTVAGAITASGGIANAGTITAGTLGANVVFPAGTTLGHKIMSSANPTSSHISTTATGFTDSGISGTYVTKKASSASFLIVSFRNTYSDIPSNTAGASTFTLTTSSNTTYAAANDMNNATHANLFLSNTGNRQLPSDALFKEGASTPSGKTTYSAGETLHFRIFIKIASSTLYFVHNESVYFFSIREIAI